MITETSRYATTHRAILSEPDMRAPENPPAVPDEVIELRAPSGRMIAYQRRRILPQGRLLPVAHEVTVTAGDRLDLIAYRTLGDPEQYWRIADANDAMNPRDLAAVPGRRLRISMPRSDARLDSEPVPEPALETPE
jgi:nucleoid-associated protein YgaU